MKTVPVVTKEKLYRLCSRLEVQENGTPAVPTAVYGFKEKVGDFDEETQKFSTAVYAGGIRGGLSLRKFLPGHPSGAKEIHTIPPPEAWTGDVYFIPADKVVDSGMDKFAASNRRLMDCGYYPFFCNRWAPYPLRAAGTFKEMCYYRCYELPEGSTLPSGINYTVDSAGYATIYADSEQDVQVVSTTCDEFLVVPALADLGWKFVGYYLCPGAEPDAARSAANREGGRLIKTLCANQDVFSLEEVESLRTLAAAPDYNIRELATRLLPAAAFDLLNAACDEVSDIVDVDLLGDSVILVEAFQEGGIDAVWSAKRLFCVADVEPVQEAVPVLKQKP